MTCTPFKLYQKLFSYFGEQNWWPTDLSYHKKYQSDPRFEIIIGAILTQNTAWTNVEKALQQLKQHNIMTIKALVSIDENHLKKLIQPSGFFNQKAQRLKHIAQYLYTNYHADLDLFFTRDEKILRQELLSLQGIGPETADSILLYAGNKPFFVIDAYTKRIAKRIPFQIGDTDTYDTFQNFFQTELKKETQPKQRVLLYQEFHALLVELAKNFCRKKPLCQSCPVHKLCTYPNSQAYL
ncbi:MAG: endonuclease [Candidatus Thermoplasmatota archaeon]